VTGKKKDVVQVGESEFESPQDGVHEELKCLGGFAQTEEHRGELE
jgi:hypothetical protein